MGRFVRVSEAALWGVAAVAMAAGCIGLTLGYDVWFHLLNGEAVRTLGGIPHRDLWLVPMGSLPDVHFPNYEWLFGVVLDTAWRLGGYVGIDLVRAGLILTCMLLTAIACRLEAGTEGWARLACPAILLLAYAAASQRFEPRPQLVSAAGLALLGVLLRRPGLAGAILLAPAALVWANCHIEILFGIGCAALMLLPGSGRPAEAAGAAKWRAVMLAELVLAVAISPAGPHLIGQTGAYYETERMIRSMGFWNVELLPLRFAPGSSAASHLVLLGAAALLVRVGRTRRLLDPAVLLTAGFCLIPFLSVRFVLPAAVVLAPPIAGAVRCGRGGRDGVASPDPFPVRPAAVFAAAMAVAGVLLFHAPAFQPGSGARPPAATATAGIPARDAGAEFPDAVIRYCVRYDIAGNIFAPDRWGNFLAWYGNPPLGAATGARRVPFVNAMFQTMSGKRVERYLAAVLRESDWASLRAEAAIDLLLLPYPENVSDPWRPFLQRIAADPAWRLAWWDDAAFLYVASGHPALERVGKTFDSARPDRWLLGGELPVEAPARDAALAELAGARGEPEGCRVGRTLRWMASIHLAAGAATEVVRLLEPECAR
ncbi:MAG TPA: hypothetical protein PLP29_10590, partial [Candidatus Ozemobacteraceae bacterium]|nr:hypothetical protein [Candidatus Ozemobacteraceae bacterium]